eukprot:CAMPEP_0171911904 /NCGR_PEP_ID=MMETSP0993-20121228/10666_1 /TAXON_ID=483369 /ORGANISM="non described non described, Strain CCMP2098" /LENGTH=35 /DNA_ID= /DNA_START= /DNA_END= /DNA_ORIENTATION=
MTPTSSTEERSPAIIALGLQLGSSFDELLYFGNQV